MHIIKKIWDANRKRTMDTFGRRLLKLGEEYGEACQAYLSISSEKNGKNKTWDDVREELVDVMVVDLDLLCHQMPDETELDFDKRMVTINEILDRKLKKWAKKQADGKDQSI